VVRREAMEHIAKGIKLSPERESPYLFLARIFKASKDVASARKVLRRASRLHPDSVELKREARTLMVGKQKRKGFLRRLFGF
jgi:Tfp pilus assembly protein PilF